MKKFQLGVTKIVWHGQARNGNFDLYLSKNFLNNAYSGRIGVATAVITALFPVATIAGAEATSLVGSIASSIAGTAFKHGQKFVVRKWKVTQRVNQ